MYASISEWTLKLDDLVKRKSLFNSKNAVSKLFAKDKMPDDLFQIELSKIFDDSLFDLISPDMTKEDVNNIIIRYTKLYEFLSFDRNTKLINLLLEVHVLESQVKSLLQNLHSSLNQAFQANQNILNLLKNT